MRKKIVRKGVIFARRTIIWKRIVILRTRSKIKIKMLKRLHYLQLSEMYEAWIVDSGSTSNMTNNKSHFQELKKSHIQIDVAKSKETMQAESIGSLEFNAVEQRLRIILTEGPKSIMDFEDMKPELPPFYDEKKFRLGQQAFYNNVFSMMIAKLCGLVSLLAISTILDVIMFTKKSSTPCLAYRRYAETVLHTVVWHEKDPKGKPNEFLESLKIVRRKHCIAFKKSTEAGVHKPTQLDMALAQFGFIGYSLVSEEYMGIKATPEEMEGVVHLWRVVGSMLGMDDKFNLCSGTVEESRALCQRLLEDVFVPSLANRNEHFNQMGTVMMESLWPLCFSIEPLAFTAFTLHLASSTARNNNHFIKIDFSNLPFYSWYLFNLQHFVLKYLMRPSAWWSSFFRAFFNGLIRYSIYFLKNFSYLAYWKFGKKYARIKIFHHRFD